MNTSAKIAARIAVIESRDFPEAKAALAKAEAALASALAADLDSAPAEKALIAARDKMNAWDTALQQLDAQWFESTSAEYAAFMAKIDADRLSTYESAAAEITRTAASLKKLLEKLVPESAAAIAADVLDKSTQALWDRLSADRDAESARFGPKPEPKKHRLTIAEAAAAEFQTAQRREQMGRLA